MLVRTVRVKTAYFLVMLACVVMVITIDLAWTVFLATR